MGQISYDSPDLFKQQQAEDLLTKIRVIMENVDDSSSILSNKITTFNSKIQANLSATENIRIAWKKWCKEQLTKALDAYKQMLKALAGYAKTNMSMIPLYSQRILTASAQLFCGRQILDQAVLAEKKAKEVGPNHFDYKFYTGKVATAKYYLRNVVPNVWAVAEIVIDGDTSAIDVPVEVFEY